MESEPTYVQVARDLWRAQREGPAGIARRRARRLSALVARARSHSPYLRRLYANLPTEGWRLSDLPPTSKPELMAAFDDWLTDRGITRDRLETFISEPSRVGAPYRDGLFVCTSSGTTGQPGIFVHDRGLIAVYRAMTVVRIDLAWFSLRDWMAVLRRGLRWAAIVGTGSHFAGTGWIEFERHRNALYRRAFRTFSVQQPLAELVEGLNAFDPAMISTYPSALTLLAEERAAGRLRVRPALLETAGESMAAAAREQASATFGRPIHDAYASAEFEMMAVDCAAGRLHVNSDWVILEPVDEAMRPTPPGCPSHTVLLTNLADRIQPFIRYDLGDSVVVAPDPCPCGSLFPTIRVEGRRDDVLRFPTPGGRTVSVLPLAIGSALEEAPGVRRGQIIQTSSSAIRVRLEPKTGADIEDVWAAALRELRAYLANQGLGHVTVIRAEEPPGQDPRSGKFRQVVAAQVKPTP